MKTRQFAPALVIAVSALALSGCTFSLNLSNPTVPASSVATAAENALEATVGSRPEVDCGDDDVPLVDGTVVDCVLTDPATGKTYDTTVKISEVKGTNYRVDVDVAPQPRE
ncbi:MAG: DUF4333 domain-containing protein [Cryobacterium sp.]|nr:DUF4333 domain-containing protein [Cryobacterium sp.]MBX3090054.1 DUF4333 domain-containing protein [Cryobacterium sp.]